MMKTDIMQSGMENFPQEFEVAMTSDTDRRTDMCSWAIMNDTQKWRLKKCFGAKRSSTPGPFILNRNPAKKKYLLGNANSYFYL
ncbi:hypothetical protein NPIL_241441 [Nephila pilipes]|uniref:Uncharacterized protein n=1 Tax=Nephila pilipes TaxID=299642 RepID=A0A8X6NQ43_NEPPI|nr:hypothetical protein NPIL_241441 [Nephila pilipes]